MFKASDSRSKGRDSSMIKASDSRSKGRNSSMVKASDSRLKGRGFESQQERWENFFLQGQPSVLTLIVIIICIMFVKLRICWRML